MYERFLQRAGMDISRQLAGANGGNGMADNRHPGEPFEFQSDIRDMLSVTSPGYEVTHMISRPLKGIVLAAAFLSSAQFARSEVIHGTQGLYATYMAYYPYGSDESFDFVTRTIVPWSSTSADLSCSGNAMGDQMTLNSKNCIGTVVDAPLEQLSEAPEGLVPFGATAELNRTYVVKTGDNIYAKFAVRSMDWAGILIEYYVQTDGSASFGPLLAVESTTWGRVKALYR